MTRSEFSALIAPFVARLAAAPIKVETPTADVFSTNARERNGMKNRGVRVSWTLALTLDGVPFSDEEFGFNFVGFKTKAEAASADWSVWVAKTIEGDYFQVLDGNVVTEFTTAMLG